MPELPEVETVLQGLMPVMHGNTIEYLQTRRPNLRYPFDTDLDTCTRNRTIIVCKRMSKYLLFRLDNGKTLISHLGMSGTYRIIAHNETVELEKHDHFFIRLNSGDTVIYNDTRRFGFLLLINTEEETTDKHLSSLGVDPTSTDLNPLYLVQKFAGKKSPIKNLLLNQSIIAGLGNIYVCEALWRSKIHPCTLGQDLSQKSIATLCTHIQDVITEAIKAGGSSLKDYRQVNGDMGYFQHTFAVYGKKDTPCSVCKTSIIRITQSNRSTFLCPACQKM